LAAQRASNIAIPGIPVAMLATASIFAIAMAGVLAVIGRIAFSLRLPEGIAVRSVDAARPGEALRAPGIAASGAFTAAAPAEARSRAVAIADSIAAAQRREEQAAAMPSRAQAVGGSVVRQAADASSQGGVPLGQSFRPRNSRRVSGSAENRDRRA
jgi:type IV secretion system protein VirB6